MTQEEVIKLAKEAGFGNYAYEAAGIFARFAAIVAATEREKCTNTQEFVTLPREVVKRALASLESEFGKHSKSASDIRAALDRPQNHVPDAGNMASAGWKLVPVEPTIHMLHRADGLTCIDFAALGREGAFDLDELKEIYRSMLAAAPQPPAVEQPRGEQEPVAWQYRMRPDWGIKKDCWGPWQDCTREQAAMYQRVPLLHEWVYESRQLYTHPQPKREPLTDEQILGFGPGQEDAEWTYEDQLYFARAIENAHNIK